jgi:hypothetical protein
MRLLVFISLCLSLAILSLSAKSKKFLQTRDLPPLKLAAADLDTIFRKTQGLITAANGPVPEQDVARESVKLGVRGHEIEIPHFSLASSVAFPKEVFKFSYVYNRPDKPISSVTIDLGDYSRRVSMTGEAPDQVESISKSLENDLRRYSTKVGGATFRRVVGVCLSLGLLTSVGLSGAYCIGNADLFGYWPVVGTSRAMEEIPSRLCTLPELLSFPFHQICASDLSPKPCCGSPRNSTVIFPFPMATESLNTPPSR